MNVQSDNKKRILWVTETGVLLALLVVFQGATAALNNQLLTGSLVNLVLAVAALTGGLWSGLTVALVSPFLAFLFGIGPQLLPIVPCIAVGNAALVTVLWLLAGRKTALPQLVIASAAASAAKFLTLHILIVQILCRILPLKEPQIAAFSTMFTWPQLITALIGCAIACVIVPVLKKALKR